MYLLGKNLLKNKQNENRILVEILVVILIIILSACQSEINPWGVWNKNTVIIDNNSIIIRKMSSGRYYEIELSGLYILKDGNEFFYDVKKNTPIIAIQGEYIKIKQFKKTDDGYIFLLIGNGFKHLQETTEFQDNTQIYLKMCFLNEDECFFEYINREDSNGFHLSYFPEEKIIYKRLRVKNDK